MEIAYLLFLLAAQATLCCFVHRVGMTNWHKNNLQMLHFQHANVNPPTSITIVQIMFYGNVTIVSCMNTRKINIINNNDMASHFLSLVKQMPV